MSKGKVGRNEPCPCGSGKKYKKCCLLRERDDSQPRSRPEDAVSLALAWLFDRHRRAAEAALDEELLAVLDEDELERLHRLPDGLRAMVQTNLGEWLLADGELEVGGRLRAVRQLLTSPGGPLLDARQRAYLERLVARPLGLYEVEEARPGEGLWLRDTLGREEPSRRWVAERSASQTLVEGDLFGARLVPGEEWTLSGSIYPLPRHHLPQLRSELLEQLDECEDPELERDVLSTVIRGAWLGYLVAPPPEIVQASSGQPLLLVTDHYRVRDWDALEAALAGQGDVEGDRANGWVRFVDSKDGTRRPRLNVNLGKPERIEAFATTLEQADEGREWLAAVAGDALAFVTREMTDPASLWDQRFEPRQPPAGVAPDEPPRMTTEQMQQVYEHTYRTWADDPIPALGGKTPRQAVADERGRQSVAELLRSYEHSERRLAADQGRGPASLDFLWQQVGLDKSP